MSITTIGNDIYLAHSSNSIIYKIQNIDGTLQNSERVVGQEEYNGDEDAFNGKDALLTNPRNIIKYGKSELFFIDNEKYIKNVKIRADQANGETIRDDFIDDVASSVNIFEKESYIFSKSGSDTAIYFIDLTKIYFIDFTNIDNIVSSSSSLTSFTFVGISYYNPALYYCYKNSTGITIKKRTNTPLQDFNISTDITINLSGKQLNFVYGFVYVGEKDKIILSGSYNSSYHFEIFNKTSTNTYTRINIIPESVFNIKALTNYNSMFPDNSYDYILGRSTSFKTYREIKILDLVNYRSVDDNVISDEIKIKDEFQIFNLTTNANIDDGNIIYSNRYYNVNGNISILYHNEINNKIELINYDYSRFRTSKVLLDKVFTKIDDIAIDSGKNLFIADNTSSTIYKVNLDTNDETKITVTHLSGISDIKAIEYLEGKLHCITNNSFHIIVDDIEVTNSGKIEKTLSNITDTDATDTLDLVTDLSIDYNYEVGYISFKQRLKWFYL